MERGTAQARAVRPREEYAFLAGLVPPSLLDIAIAEAQDCAMLPQHVLIARGWLSSQAYLTALSKEISRIAPRPSAGAHASLAIDAMSLTPDAVRAEARRAAMAGSGVLLVDPSARGLLEPSSLRLARLDRAAHAFHRANPDLSAASPVATWQTIALIVSVGLLAGGVPIAGTETMAALSAVLVIPFLCVVAFRVAALSYLIAARTARQDVAPLSAAELPTYSVLVPLYREAAVLPDCIDALSAIDYPPAKLDIMILLEDDDAETVAAAERIPLAGHIRFIRVPAGQPRTKPKALNFGLSLARGEYVVVYDAEDIPDPQQLRRAAAVFTRAGPDLACLQAKLNIHNAQASWLTRQFAIEYSALFDALVPMLARLNLPIPLGGTSNHFPRRVLDAAGGWDPFNVTEDADLGLRLARRGGRIAVLDSTTWEEAPRRFHQWLPQRTRWLKGWMVTLLVHLRSPRLLTGQLGVWRTLGLLIITGGMMMSSVVHLVFYAVALWHLVGHGLLVTPETLIGRVVLFIALVNLSAGYLSSMLLGFFAATRRHGTTALWALTMPAYWLLISFAALRAAHQLVREPYLWEKTPHEPRRPRG